MLQFALSGTAEPLGGCQHNNQGGGKNNVQSGQFGFVRAQFGGVSLKFHWRLNLRCFGPRPLLLRPLCTTFVHILRLTGLLSIRNLEVMGVSEVPSEKAPSLVENRVGHYKMWGLRQ